MPRYADTLDPAMQASKKDMSVMLSDSGQPPHITRTVHAMGLVYGIGSLSIDKLSREVYPNFVELPSRGHPLPKTTGFLGVTHFFVTEELSASGDENVHTGMSQYFLLIDPQVTFDIFMIYLRRRTRFVGDLDPAPPPCI
jgi:hypothetical protein